MTEVILLLFIGTILIVLNVNAIKKDKKSFSGTLKDKEDNIKDYQIEIGQLRRELSETVLELQKEIEALKLKRETNNNFKKERYDNNLEDTELYTSLYEENSYNDEKKITKETEDEDFEQDFRKELLKGIESMQNNKLNEQEKNEIKYEDKKIVEQIIENNAVQQNEYEDKKEAELQREDIYEIKDEVQQQGENKQQSEEKKKNYIKKTDNGLNNYNITNENNKSSYNSVKVDEIKEMIDNGLSVDEISEKIGIGKGEVLLIKELYIK